MVVKKMKGGSGWFDESSDASTNSWSRSLGIWGGAGNEARLSSIRGMQSIYNELTPLYKSEEGITAAVMFCIVTSAFQWLFRHSLKDRNLTNMSVLLHAWNGWCGSEGLRIVLNAWVAVGGTCPIVSNIYSMALLRTYLPKLRKRLRQPRWELWHSSALASSLYITCDEVRVLILFASINCCTCSVHLARPRTIRLHFSARKDYCLYSLRVF